MVNFLRKRLQVFVSSTYVDLQQERQAAVEAILTAGHIPAGMELFAAGDESQMEVIRQWIDESDIFMLILGGRYGTVEPKSGQSYVHLEYEYAMTTGKPTSCLVVSDEGLDRLVKERGRSAIEGNNPQGLRQLRDEITKKMVRFWTDAKDIRIAVGEALSQHSRREDLQGWVRPQDQSNVPQLASEIARLSKENSELRAKLANVEPQAQPLGVGYAGILKILQDKNLLDTLLSQASNLVTHIGLKAGNPGLPELLELGLIERLASSPVRVVLAQEGRAFLNWYKLRHFDSDQPPSA